jgi:hypothetical protein
MSQRVYIDQILEPIVKPWIDHGAALSLKKTGIQVTVLGRIILSKTGNREMG